MSDDIEVESFNTTVRDFEAITSMLHNAEVEGLLVEVVWSFHQAASAGDNIPQATGFALSEWDII